MANPNKPVVYSEKKWKKELVVEQIAKSTTPITDELSMRALGGSFMPKKKKVKVTPKTKAQESLDEKKYVDAV